MELNPKSDGEYLHPGTLLVYLCFSGSFCFNMESRGYMETGFEMA